MARSSRWRARGEIIDRIAASVGNRVITASDLDRQIRVTAFQDGVKPDFSPAHKRAMAESMIEQKLDPVELANSRYPLPDPAELVPAIEQFKKEHFKDDAAYQRRAGRVWHHRGGFQGTVVVAAHPAVVHPGAIRDRRAGDRRRRWKQYFTKTVKPAAEAAHPGQAVSLDDYREQIERKLTGQRADQQMDIWLREVRRRTNVVVHEEALR